MSNPVKAFVNKARIDLSEEVRRTLGLALDGEIAVLREGAAVTLVPVRAIESYKGLLKGVEIDYSMVREKQDKHR